MNIACNFRPTKYCCQFFSFFLLPHNLLPHSHIRHTYKTQLLNRLTYQNTHTCLFLQAFLGWLVKAWNSLPIILFCICISSSVGFSWWLVLPLIVIGFCQGELYSSSCMRWSIDEVATCNSMGDTCNDCNMDVILTKFCNNVILMIGGLKFWNRVQVIGDSPIVTFIMFQVCDSNPIFHFSTMSIYLSFFYLLR